jgi:hypothetical protein
MLLEKWFKNHMFESWQDTKMVVVANGVEVFVAALHVQKYSDTNCTRIIQPLQPKALISTNFIKMAIL